MIKYIIAAIAGIAAGFLISMYAFVDRGTPPGTRNAARPAENLRQEIDALIKGLSSPDPKARSIFHRNLIERTGIFFGFKPSAFPEERAAVVERWVNWWAKNRDKTKEQWLIDSLSLSDFVGKPLAVRMLAEMSSAASVPPITALLESTDSQLRLEAARALGRLKAESAAALIKRLERDEDVMVRRAAARSLGQIATQDALAALQRTTGQEDLIVRIEAAEALLHLSPERALPVLHSFLANGDESTRMFAITRLAHLRSPQSVPHLARLLGTGGKASKKAHELLKTIVGRDLGPNPTPYLDWHKKQKRQSEEQELLPQ